MPSTLTKIFKKLFMTFHLQSLCQKSTERKSPTASCPISQHTKQLMPFLIYLNMWNPKILPFSYEPSRRIDFSLLTSPQFLQEDCCCFSYMIGKKNSLEELLGNISLQSGPTERTLLMHSLSYFFFFSKEFLRQHVDFKKCWTHYIIIVN